MTFRSKIPDEFRESIKKEAGKFCFGIMIHDSWPANWYEVHLRGAVERGLRDVARRIMHAAACRAGRPQSQSASGGKSDWYAKKIADHVVTSYLGDLLDAARLPPRVRKWEVEIDKKMDEMSEMFSARRRKYNAEIKELKKQALKARSLISDLSVKFEYRDVPDPICPATDDGESLPDGPGVYFVWRMDRVVYVGQSVHLCKRANLKHERIQHGDLLSWLEVPMWELDFAESFYIGICRPRMNFGKKAKHLTRSTS